MTDRELSAAEARWWKRFKAVARSMPKTVEIIVRHGSMSIADIEARREYFDKMGHADGTPSLDCIYHRGFYPNGESL